MIRIFSPEELAKTIENIRESYKAADYYCKFVMTSGGYDPLHSGHLSCFKEASRLGNFWIAVVNGDGFLVRKKGSFFLPEQERANIVGALKYVHYVCIWDDGTQFVDGAIKLLKPDIFAKGGDRSTTSSIAKSELIACKDVKCRLVLGVGGQNKINSSQDILKNFANQAIIK